MRFRAYLFFFFFISSFPAAAQSLYELVYYFELPHGREDYRAFVLREDDDTGLIRLAYQDLKTNSRNIVEMEFVEEYGRDDKGNIDSSLLILVGLNQRQITGGVMYPPDNFVFEFDPQTGYYEPSFVLSINNDDSEDIGTLDSIIFLNQEDLTMDLVSRYFTPEENFYKELFVNEVRGLTDQEKQTQLHLILVANTDDKTIGNTCKVDRETMFKTYSDLAEFLGIRFNPVVLEGKDFSKVNVDKAINNLRPSSNDIVIFYYSGHGFSDTRDNYRFPYLDLRDKSYQTYGGQYTLNIEAIYQKIKAKGARMNLVLSDCCNNDPTQTTHISTEGATTRTSQIGWSIEKCRALFLGDKPVSVLMTAASKGELSGGNSNSGGIFTFNFMGTLEQFIGKIPQSAAENKPTTWQSLLDEAMKTTVNKANHTLCRQPDESLKRCKQTPVFKIE